MLLPILAGIGALCLSNPRRRRKARRGGAGKKANPRSTAWSSADNTRAMREGWAIFNIDDFGNGGEIQRDDERGKFSSDDAAIAHIRRKARAGSAFHRRALAAVKGTKANPKPRDLTEQEFTRGPARVTVATWRNASSTAFVAVSARGPEGVKTWEAKSQGPSSGGYSKPQQALERVFNKMTRDWPKTQGDTLIKQIAGIAGEHVGGPQYDWKTQTNPRRSKRRNRL